MAAGSAVAILAAVQEAARLLQVQRLGDTCAISGDRGCRPLVIPDTVDALHRLDRRAGVLLISGLSLLAAGGVAWLVWQHRAHRLLRDPLATPGLRWSPGWAVGWWFVPVANLVMPPIVAGELWQASGGEDDLHADWRARRRPALLRWWWAFVLGAVVLAAFAHGQADPAGASFTQVRLNALVLTAACAAAATAGLLGIGLLRSIERRLERAAPYGSPEAPEPAAEEPPAAERTRTRWVLVGSAFAVGALGAFLFVSSPAIVPIEDPAFHDPSPVTFSAPAGWQQHGGAELGFVMSAPPAWRATDDGSPALLRLEPSDGADAACLVIGDPRSAGQPLPGVVAELLTQIHDPTVYALDGSVDVSSLTLGAGRAERLRFTAQQPAGERGYVQYVLVDDRAGWLIGCDAPRADVGSLEPTFERMISTFRFAG